MSEKKFKIVLLSSGILIESSQIFPLRRKTMDTLASAVNSGNIWVMIWTGAFLGCLHTILGPDHYVPFVMMAKAEKWPQHKTLIITILCGLGHVLSSVVIGIILIALGTAVGEWQSGIWGSIHEWRGAIAAWLLMGFGMAFFVRGLIRAHRGQKHSHFHHHGNGTIEFHEHDHVHEGEHLHPHFDDAKPENSITPWILFTIFVFGPCESLIPLMLAAYSDGGFAGSFLVSLAFSATTVVTIVATTSFFLAGLNRLPFEKIEKYSKSLAGFSLIACGAAIQFLGL